MQHIELDSEEGMFGNDPQNYTQLNSSQEFENTQQNELNRQQFELIGQRNQSQVASDEKIQAKYEKISQLQAILKKQKEQARIQELDNKMDLLKKGSFVSFAISSFAFSIFRKEQFWKPLAEKLKTMCSQELIAIPSIESVLPIGRFAALASFLAQFAYLYYQRHYKKATFWNYKWLGIELPFANIGGICVGAIFAGLGAAFFQATQLTMLFASGFLIGGFSVHYFFGKRLEYHRQQEMLNLEDPYQKCLKILEVSKEAKDQLIYASQQSKLAFYNIAKEESTSEFYDLKSQIVELAFEIVMEKRAQEKK
ncbi:hypothetical protein FGO68_gene10091 [Halteria grandinella]|uniref:Transmembrane protein n=1 Tax=Halteria grandinella TaxID=5974 RepID=A0A8J8SZW2_HALGN|nr:hypothetical protein FGO68_gene10091 [Halteria grandinella]